MYKAIIFDFFGVIRGEAYETWLDARGLKREGVYLDAVRSMDRGTISVDDFLQILSDEVGDDPQVILKEINRSAVVNESVVTLIKSLRSRYKLGLLSNASRGILQPLLDDHDLGGLFDEIVVSSDVGFIKPSPQIFTVMLERLRVNAEESLFVDDNAANVRGAENVGIQGIVFSGVVALRHDLKRYGV